MAPTVSLVHREPNQMIVNITPFRSDELDETCSWRKYVLYILLIYLDASLFSRDNLMSLYLAVSFASLEPISGKAAVVYLFKIMLDPDFHAQHFYFDVKCETLCQEIFDGLVRKYKQYWAVLCVFIYSNNILIIFMFTKQVICSQQRCNYCRFIEIKPRCSVFFNFEWKIYNSFHGGALQHEQILFFCYSLSFLCTNRCLLFHNKAFIHTTQLYCDTCPKSLLLNHYAYSNIAKFTFFLYKNFTFYFVAF